MKFFTGNQQMADFMRGRGFDVHLSGPIPLEVIGGNERMIFTRAGGRNRSERRKNDAELRKVRK